ncbi:P-loop NTPase fold protein [uncultured Psychrobacter sp.]|uniref:KAP family P-loop NTPase fold protein n=1 Tax=uncultured Psychrobacter sp. TaxID=259303 RepID=UPI00345AA9E4
MTTENYSSDAPVSTKDEDIFSRWKFSERVAQVIANRRDPSSIVIGLYGRWGDGKTSVLNFIEQSLNTNDDVICIKFNPWRFGTEDQLLMGFFNQIADALDAKLETREDKLKDIGNKILKPISSAAGMGVVGDIVSSYISMPDIEIFKSRTEQLLEKSQKRVLILIDDVDRLDKIEIHALFRLVKLTADFKYTSYILAFDKDIVASSLQDRYSTSKGNSGEAFLEKIIQVPLHLPYIDEQTLINLCYQGAEEALEVSGIEITEEQAQDFARNFKNGFSNCITTPRKAKKYGNILMFSLPILKGEVNPIELMLIEGIRVFYPQLYETIRSNEHAFTGTLPREIYTDNENEKTRVKNLIENALINKDFHSNKGIIKLLKNIFPKINSVYDSGSYDSSFYTLWNNNQSVCSSNYFSRYFGYSIKPEDISDVSIGQLIETLNSWEEPYSNDSNPLKKILTAQNADILIKKLQDKAEILDKKVLKSLAVAIVQLSNNFPKIENLFWEDAYTQSAWLIAELIVRSNRSEQVRLAKLCFDYAATIGYQTTIFKWLYHEKRKNPHPDSFSTEEVNKLGTYLCTDILSKITSIDITIEEPDSVAYAFHLLSIYLGKEYVGSYVNSLLNSDINALYRILNAYTVNSYINGIKNKGSFTEKEYITLSNDVNTSIIFDHICRNYSTLLIESDEYPKLKNKEEDRDSIIVQQFLWWYRQEAKKIEKYYMKDKIFTFLSELVICEVPFINNINA